MKLVIQLSQKELDTLVKDRHISSMSDLDIVVKEQAYGCDLLNDASIEVIDDSEEDDLK